MNDHDIPDEGINLSCPRCKNSFHIPKPRRKMTSAFATNTCPSCGYSTFCEEVFDECPQCGVVVKTVVERKREDETRKRELEILNRNYRSDTQPLPPVFISEPLQSPTAEADQPRKVSLAIFADGFDPVAAVGWGAAGVAVIVLLLGLWGLMHYLGTDIQTQLSEQSVEPVTAWQVFWGYGFLPWIETLFGASILVAAFGFLRRESWGLPFMQQVVVSSLVLVPVYELTRYVLWIVKSIAPPWWAYLIELVSAMLFSALLMAPLYVLLRYLRGSNLKEKYLKTQSVF